MTKAIILAAGQGTRLRPITNDRPKCLVPLMGKTLLEYQVEILKSAGVTNIHIVTGYRADQIVDLGFETSYNSRFKTTNMVESLFTAIEFINDCKEDLIIAYGDIIYSDNNLSSLLSCNDQVSLMIDKEWRKLWSLRLDNPLEDAETLLVDKEGYVTNLGEKPKDYDEIQGQYTGLIKIRADKLSDFTTFYERLNRNEVYDGNDFNNMYMTSFIQMLINNSWKVKAVNVENGWLEVDTVDDLNIYERLMSKGIIDKELKICEGLEG